MTPLAIPPNADRFDAYTTALVLAIAVALLISWRLRHCGCVSKSFFSVCTRGWIALALGSVSCIICFLSREISTPLILDHDKVWMVPLYLSQWVPPRLLENSILLTSVASFYYLLRTSGGITGPFSSYLTMFPMVISVISRSPFFVVTTVILTLVIAVLNVWYTAHLKPENRHKDHMGHASIITLAISLAYTALLLIAEMSHVHGTEPTP